MERFAGASLPINYVRLLLRDTPNWYEDVLVAKLQHVFPATNRKDCIEAMHIAHIRRSLERQGK